MCAVVRLRALMARQAARLITIPPITTAGQNNSLNQLRIKLQSAETR
jgi:hypothetical protein